MTDTGQVPGEGLPENAGMVEQPGIPAPGAYTYLDPSENAPEEDDLLLMPGSQGAWSDTQPGVAPVLPGVGPQGPVSQAPVVQAPVSQHYADASVPTHAPAAMGLPVDQAPLSEPVASGHHFEAPAQVQMPAGSEFVAQEFMAPDLGAPAPVMEPVVAAFGAEQPVSALEALLQTEPGAEPAPMPEPVMEPVVEPVAGQVSEQVPEPGAHEADGRDSGSVDLSGVRIPPTSATPTPPPARRPLHMGPPVPDSSGGVVRSLADRGPAGQRGAGGGHTPPHPMPAPVPAAATTGVEYLDFPRDESSPLLPGPQLGEIPPQAGTPWDPRPSQPEVPSAVRAETVVPEPVPVAPDAPAVAEAPVQEPAVQEPAVQDSAPEPEHVGQFVPVDGSLPTTPHLAPTPVPATATPEPAAEAEPEPEAVPAPEPEPVPVQEAEAPVEHEADPRSESAQSQSQSESIPEPEAEVIVPAPRDGGSEAPLEAEAVPAPEPVVAEEPAPQPEPESVPVAAGTAPAPAYDDVEREAVLRVMRERRDIRNGFRSDPIPHEVLLRVLEAAHTAPSVGHSQPWDFVVIRSAETRRSMHELAQRQREAYAKSLPKGRAKQFKELKIEAILDTPVNIVVTADPTRGGRHTLGRHTQPQMAPYSSALAVENLWLAARAEGLGVGWVSFFDEREMVRALGLPEHLEVVAYLCVGYVDEFPEEPELMQAGWSKRRPLSWVVHEETYGRRALPGEEPHDLLQETVSTIRPLDAKALGEAWERQKRMTKPAGALGMLEIISAQLSGLSRMCPPPIPEPAAVAIFAGDHGVHAQGVTTWPQEVTAQMVANFLGGGAVCNAFANQVGAEVCVVDVGVAGDLPATPGLLPRKVRPGTADFTTGPALSREEVHSAVEVGIETARDLVAAGNKALLTGEMGIANTTVSAALISVYTGMDPGEVTGRGTGINDEMHARKVDVVRRALDLHAPDPADPIGVLSAVGGLEHAALVGFILGGASLRTPVVLDGVSAGAAALVARAIAPEALAACIAGHRSAEPGHVAALNKLGLRPLVDLDLRLGEGTGALLALPVVQSAARAMHEVATFDSAGVTEK
ncbi:nicotinate-nucleotide--dimethylbenzimidazole phosphoribosyltransferase [Streptomyces lunaelactis]|uniref:nicotinate-nucleotide--dimethylbenzimidazole phosphoribosyltransferase n=1 Tax=Streptomyces lunaelactis TaxID=1535768 RepID=UPI0015847CCD|nr:nicotinate-nucleotide--dimethylbenzimidazole phosphoribosyltransferase [Streptomyces lunaelactis]NUL02367.1 nicotinate-nucleotide--dimethylbenzimidazole phosphoribosyltransferase [Streptomyces lunaelactis]